MTEANIAFVARLLADPTRAAMCLALAGGEARPAGELAARAGVPRRRPATIWPSWSMAASCASSSRGAGATTAWPAPTWAMPSRRSPSWRRRCPPVCRRRPARRGAPAPGARTCYSHLAGRLGVALADALVAERWMEEDGRSYRLTPTGTRSLRALGIEVRGRLAQPVARRCLDWTERRPHVAGPVGTALASLALDRGWVRRVRGTRAVVVTPAGRAQLKKVFNVRWEERTP